MPQWMGLEEVPSASMHLSPGSLQPELQGARHISVSRKLELFFPEYLPRSASELKQWQNAKETP